MRRISLLISLALVLGAATAGSVPAASTERSASHRYVVVVRDDASLADARAALRDAGARVVAVNDRVGVATVESGSPTIRADLMSTGLFTGVARNRRIGGTHLPLGRTIERLDAPRVAQAAGRAAAPAPPKGGDPLARFQWNLNMIDADFGGSYAVERGDRRVLVGILDSGIDPNHPDVKRNLDRELSRNFTRDIPSIDGPCREERDRSCDDPHLGDPAGHGTAVASMVAAPLNDSGISGVAPNVTLVSLRVGQDSPFVFVQPVVDALTYAADNGIDVANLSFWIDPWWLNCPSNPADSPEARQDQQTTIAAVQAAVDYARARGVTVVAATANDWTDLGNPTTDTLSPTFPLDSAYEREVDNTCLLLPVEAEGVVGVSGVGPSGRKAFYSNYGSDATDVTAPSGDDFDDTLRYPYNLVLVAFPKAPLKRFGLLDPDGRPTIPEVVRHCSRGRCSYYVFLGGTSFAGPTAAGVAALIVSAHGTDDAAGGLTMEPADVERILYETARPHPCPEDGVQEYPEIGDKLVEFGLPSWEAFTATCTEGPGQTNSFFGHGLVDARQAVAHRP